MSDAINPDHYKRLPAEAIEIIESAIDNAPSNRYAYLHGQVLKYILRCWNKNGIEDLKKAKWYLDRLVNSLDECEQQKASDLQSLKDHPFGKLKEQAIKQSLNTEPPDGWRPNDNVSLAMQMAANSFGGKDGVFNGANFSNAMRKLAGVNCNFDGHVVATILEGRSDVEVLKGGSHYRYLLYESINSSQEPAEQPKVTGHFDDVEGVWIEEKSPFDGRRNSDTIPEGYRKLNDSSEEPRQLGDLRWSVAGKRYVEISVDEIGYANRDNWAACRKVEPAIKQSLTPDPPEGLRWLEVGEVIRKGDVDRSMEPVTNWWIGEVCGHNHDLLRRNRFEVGEKVIGGLDGFEFVVVGKHSRFNDVYVLRNKITGTIHNILDRLLVPYIEEAK